MGTKNFDATDTHNALRIAIGKAVAAHGDSLLGPECVAVMAWCIGAAMNGFVLTEDDLASAMEMVATNVLNGFQQVREAAAKGRPN